MFHPLCLFLKLQAHAQGAKVVALSSVVAGKEVESEAIALHRELESESLSSLFLTACLALFLLNVQLNYSTQIEMSSTETENKQCYRLKYHYNKYVITIVKFWPTCHVLNAAAAYVENVMEWNVMRIFSQHDFMNEMLTVYETWGESEVVLSACTFIETVKQIVKQNKQMFDNENIYYSPHEIQQVDLTVIYQRLTF